MSSREVQLRISSVFKNYPEHDVHALADVSLDVFKGEFVALVGPSGCGKSTLLNLVAGIDRPTGGSITLGGMNLAELSDDELTRVRRDKVGFVFQFFNLISTLTAAENVALPLEIAGRSSPSEISNKTLKILEKTGMAPRASFFPSQLSGGEMQRVAVARALVHSPELIVADEPTGNLDSDSGKAVLSMLRDLTRTGGHTVIMATHSAEACTYADRIVRLKDGRVQEVSS